MPCPDTFPDTARPAPKIKPPSTNPGVMALVWSVRASPLRLVSETRSTAANPRILGTIRVLAIARVLAKELGRNTGSGVQPT